MGTNRVLTTREAVEYVSLYDPAIDQVAMGPDAVDEYDRTLSPSLLRFRDGMSPVVFMLRPLSGIEHAHVTAAGREPPDGGAALRLAIEYVAAGLVSFRLPHVPDGSTAPPPLEPLVWRQRGPFRTVDPSWILRNLALGAGCPSGTEAAIYELAGIVMNLTRPSEDDRKNWSWGSGRS
jgi:hypothetical protein